MAKHVCVLALAAVLMAGCGETKTESAGATPSASPAAAAPATVSAPVNAPGNSALAQGDDGFTASGPLIVEHQVEITAQREGVVSKIYMNANLEAARAKTRSIENDLKNWQAESEVMKSDYARAQKAWEQGLIPQEQLEHAKYKAESEQWDIKRVTELLNTSRQEERSLELEMEKNRIIAPFDSLVARRYAREGQDVVRGERLFWVTAEAPLLLRFTLPEKFLGRVKIGQTLPLTSPDVPKETYTARIKEVSPVVDPSSGTFDVLVELQGARGELRPGMTASVHVDAAR